jgi:hypothetical protein
MTANRKFQAIISSTCHWRAGMKLSDHDVVQMIGAGGISEVKSHNAYGSHHTDVNPA